MPHPVVASSRQLWTTTAPTYSSNVGRTSALSASRLLQLTDSVSPITNDSLVLDVGAGTGAVALALASGFPNTRIVATDISASMLENISEVNCPNITTRVLDARDLNRELDKGSFSHVFNTFMLQSITTPIDALCEIHDVLAPSGVVGVALWAQRNGPFEIWEAACKRLEPGYELPAPFDDPGAWKTQGELETSLEEVGFIDARTEEVKMPFEFENAEAFAEFWFQAKNPAPVKVMTDWPQERMEEVREMVCNVVREEYADGKGIYTWAVLGVGKKQANIAEVRS